MPISGSYKSHVPSGVIGSGQICSGVITSVGLYTHQSKHSTYPSMSGSVGPYDLGATSRITKALKLVASASEKGTMSPGYWLAYCGAVVNYAMDQKHLILDKALLRNVQADFGDAP